MFLFDDSPPSPQPHRAHLTPLAWGRRQSKTRKVTSGGLRVITEHKYMNNGLHFPEILCRVFIHKDTANREGAIYGNNEPHLNPERLHLITFFATAI